MIKFRIKQISESEFLPQVAEGFMNVLFRNYKTIQQVNKYTLDSEFPTLKDFSLWNVETTTVVERCVKPSWIETKVLIMHYKDAYNKAKGYPQYHKV